MARLKLDELMKALTDLGVEFDPSLSYKELYDLYLSKKEGKTSEVLPDNSETTTTEEEETAKPTEETSSVGITATEPIVIEPPIAPPEKTGEKAVMKINVKHNGKAFLSGEEVFSCDDKETFDYFKAQGFLA